jgi:hypothetical protein
MPDSWRAVALFHHANDGEQRWTGRWRTRPRATTQARGWQTREHGPELLAVWIESADGHRLSVEESE